MSKSLKFKPKKDGDGAYVYHIAGVCPECGDADVTYGSMESGGGEDIFYPTSCKKGHNFREWYHLEFIESVTR